MAAIPFIDVPTSARPVRCHFRRIAGSWYADFRVHGKRLRFCLKTDTLARAKQKALEEVRKAANLTGNGEGSTWRMLHERYLAEVFPSAEVTAPYALTRRTHKSCNLDFVEWIEAHEPAAQIPGDLDCDHVTGLLQRWLNFRRAQGVVRSVKPEKDAPADAKPKTRRSDISATTLDNHRRAVQALITWATAAKLLPWRDNPARKKALKLPKVEIKQREPVSRQRLDKLVEALKWPENVWMYPAVLMVLANGFRPIGTTRLKWGDVDMFGRKTKLTEKRVERVVHLSKWLVDELLALKTELKPADEDLIIPYKRDWLSRSFTKVAKAVLGENTPIRLANLRNTFMALHLEAGTPAQFVAQQAGNSIRTIERHYSKLSNLKGTPYEIDLRPKPPAPPAEESPQAEAKQA